MVSAPFPLPVQKQRARRQPAGGEGCLTLRQAGEKCGEFQRFQNLQRRVSSVAFAPAVFIFQRVRFIVQCK